MKSILVHIHEDAGQNARLQAALDTARYYSGHLTCLQAMLFAVRRVHLGRRHALAAGGRVVAAGAVTLTLRIR